MSFHDVLKRGDEEILSTRSPNHLWNFASQITGMAVTGFCKIILCTLYNVEVKGLENFDQSMASARAQNRGFLTYMNHMSTCDDPMLFACLPWKYMMEWNNIRWGLAASNVCFTNKASSTFFSLGKIFPCDRFGRGPFQSGLDACIRILSPDDTIDHEHIISEATHAQSNSLDSSTALSRHAASLFSPKYTPPVLRYKTSWIHIFPEGYVCQLQAPHQNSMRFFRWGTARLILEPTVAPVVLPIFTDGFEKIKPEEISLKTDFLTPNNVGAQITVNIGKPIEDSIIAGWRQEWRNLCNKYPNSENPNDLSDELKWGAEAKALRSKVCDYLREKCALLRLENGFEEEDPRFKSVDFWTRYTKSRGESDPDIKFVGLNWAIKEYQKHVNVYDAKGNVIGTAESERPEGM
ncbi:lysophosphatidylcholine acyltransferase [Martiniozyma asiatica (nom. inval.)]|nr:lysophosphatidylcholine acyltransferase [Martiniozyma asiatica]